MSKIKVNNLVQPAIYNSDDHSRTYQEEYLKVIMKLRYLETSPATMCYLFGGKVLLSNNNAFLKLKKE